MINKFSFAHATVVGTGHIARGLECQDKTAVYVTDTCICAVLADGAGSYSDSHVGAQIVSSEISKFAAENFDTLYNSTDAAVKSFLFDEMDRLELSSKTQFNCTFLLAAIHEDGRSLVVHIGDGYIIKTNSSGDSSVFSQPENGEEKNITWFISSFDREQHTKIYKSPCAKGESYLLCSDGAGESLVKESTGEVAKAVGIISDWVQKYDFDIVSAQLSVELDSSFRAHTADDMGIAVISRKNIPG